MPDCQYSIDKKSQIDAKMEHMCEPLLTLRIPMRATSLNKWMRMNWQAKRRHRADTTTLVRSVLPWEAINSVGYPLQQQVRLRIIAYMRSPLLDADNIVIKDLVDALKKWIIPDDSERFVAEVTPVVMRNETNIILIEVYPADQDQ